MAITGSPRVRVTGHAYTLWIWGGNPIAYATNVTHTSPQPLAQAADVTPLNYIRPAEIVTGRAIGRGEITMTVTELYGHKPWNHLGGSFNGNDIRDLADVFHKFQREYTEHTPENAIRFVRVIRPPGSGVYIEQYHNIRILDIREDETDTPDSLVNSLTISIGYTHKDNRTPTQVGGNFSDPGNDPVIADPRVYGDW